MTLDVDICEISYPYQNVHLFWLSNVGKYDRHNN